MKKIIAFLLFLVPLLSNSQEQKHFAELKNDTVIRVIVIDSDSLARAMFGGTWVETFISDSTKNYAGIGSVYHADKQNFSSPRPYPSWTLDDKLHWQPPTPYPQGESFFYWDEKTKSWSFGFPDGPIQ